MVETRGGLSGNHRGLGTGSVESAVLAAGDGGRLVVPGGHFLLTAQFSRLGNDLLLTGPQGQSILIPGYFSHQPPVTLVSEGGGVLPPDLVARLAGPQAGAQLVQAETGAAGSASLLGEPVGKFDKVEGEATVRRADGTSQVIKSGDVIYPSDVVETKGDGAVGLVFADRSTFALGPSGRLVVDEFVYDPQGQTGASSLSVVQGKFTFESGDVAKLSPNAMTVRTPVMSIGIRGTKVAGVAAAEGSQNVVSLLPGDDGVVGQIAITNGSGVTQVLSSPNQTIQLASATQVLPPPVVLPPSAIQQLYSGVSQALPSQPAGRPNLEPGKPASAPSEKAPIGDKGGAAKAEGKAEGKAEEGKAEAKPDGKAEEGKAEAKPDAKPEEGKAEAKPDAKPEESKAEAKPDAKPEEGKAETKAEAKAEATASTTPQATAAQGSPQGEAAAPAATQGGGEAATTTQAAATQTVAPATAQTTGSATTSQGTASTQTAQTVSFLSTPVTSSPVSSGTTGLASAPSTLAALNTLASGTSTGSGSSNGSVTVGGLTLTAPVVAATTTTTTSSSNNNDNNNQVQATETPVVPVVSTPVHVNTPPTLINGNVSIAEDATLTFSAAVLRGLYQDADGNSLSRVRLDSLPADGIVRLNGQAVSAGDSVSIDQVENLTFVPSSNWSGTTSFQWSGFDGEAWSSNSSTVTVTVSAVDDAPVVGTGASLSMAEDGNAITITTAQLLQGISDVEGGALSVSGLSVTHGTLTVVDASSWTFVPDADYYGSAVLSYQVGDGTGNTTAVTLPISITAVNDAPAAAINDGSAIDFDGTADHVITTNLTIPTLSTDDVTLEVWVKTTGTNQAVFTKSDGDAIWEIGERCLYIGQQGQAVFVGYSNGYILGTEAVNDGQWHHIAIVWDYSGSGSAGTGTVYVDGVECTDRDSSDGSLGTDYHYDNPDNSSDVVRIGEASQEPSDGGNRFDGALSDLRVWSIVRTASQIADSMYNILPSSTAGLVANYPMLENSGTAITTSSGGFPGYSSLGLSTVNGPVGQESYTEDGAPVLLAGNLTVSDVDNATLTGATLTIDSGMVTGDWLNFTAQNGITGSYNSGTGVLTLSGTASAAQYQAALRSITFSSTSDTPGSGTRTVLMTVQDGAATSDPVAVQVAVTPYDDVPVVAVPGAAVAFTEAGPTVAPLSSLTISDADSTSLVSATVSIGGFVADDALGFVNQSGIAGSYNSATGVLTLTGSATLAQYQTALRSVTYYNNGDNPGSGNRTLSVTVNDGVSNSVAVSGQSTVTPVNDAPVVSGAALAAVTLNGTSNSVLNTTIGTQINLAKADFTLEAWIKTSAVSQGIITKSNGNAGWDGGEKSFFINSSGQPTFVGFGNDYINSTQVVNDGQWHHVAVVWDYSGSGTAGTGKIYVDGVDVTGTVTYAATNVDNSGDVLRIGAPNFFSGEAPNYFNGQISDVRVWTAARTASQIADNKGTPLDSGTSGLLANYRFPETSGSVSTSSNGTYTATSSSNMVLSTAAVSYTEDGAAAAIAPGLQLSDVDSSTLSQATLTISSGFVAGDRLNFTDQNGITGSYNSATGVLTLTGSATSAHYQTALRSVTFSTTSDNPGNGSRTIGIVVSDGALSSGNVDSTVAVTLRNDLSVVTPSGSAVSYSEGDANSRPLSALTIADSDSTNLTGATVTISSGRVAGDTLSIASQNGISGSYNSTTGVLTLTGTATLAQYQTALQGIVFSTGDDPGSSDRILSVVVNDNGSTTTAVTQTVQVTPVNDAPLATGLYMAISSGASTNISKSSLLSYATDSDGGTLDTSGWSVDFGTLTSTSGTDVVFDPGAYSGPVTLSYTVTDGQGGSTPNTLTLYQLPAGVDSAGMQVGERKINTVTTGDQTGSSVAGLSDGGYVVVWASAGEDGAGYGVYAQRYYQDGSKAGSAFKVNTTTNNDQKAPQVAAYSGGFVVVWNSLGQDGGGGGIYAKRYDLSGTVTSGASDLQVVTYTQYDQFQPAVSSTADGGYVITWTSVGPDYPSTNGIFAQRFSAAGVAPGNEFAINAATIGDQSVSSVVGLADGGFVAVWQSDTASPGVVMDADGFGIISRRFTATGTPAGDEVKVNTNIVGEQVTPSVAALRGGGYVVVWRTNDADGTGIAMRRFDASGNSYGDKSALHIDGNDAATITTNVGTQANLSTGDFTLELWVRTGSTSAALLTKSNSDSAWDSSEKVFYLDSTGKPTFAGFGNGSIASTLAVNDNLWHHLAVVWDYSGSGTAGVAKIYIDGIDRTGTVTYTATVADDAGDVIRLGKRNYDASTATNNLNGQLSDVRIWDVARSETQIVSNKDVVLSSSTSGLVANFAMSETTGTAITSTNGSFSGSSTSSVYPFAGPPVSEVTVNVTTAGNQEDPVVVALDNGGYVVGWASQNMDSGGLAAVVRVYDASGNPVSGEMQVNTTEAADQSDMAISALRGGGFIVTWTSAGQDGDAGGIYSQRFNSDGSKHGGGLLIKGTSGADALVIEADYAGVLAGAGDDSLTLTGNQIGSDQILLGGSGTDTLVVSDGVTLLDSDFANVSEIEALTLAYGGASAQSVTLGRVSLAAAITQVNASAALGAVTVDASGRSGAVTFVGGHGNDSLTGSTASTDTLSYTGAASGYVLSASGGRLVVSDQTANRDGTDSLSGIETLVFADRTFTYGVSSGAEYKFSTQDGPFTDMIQLANGYHVMFYSPYYNGDGSNYAMYAQMFNNADVKVGNMVQLASVTAGGQAYPSAVALADGGYVAFYASTHFNNSDDEIFYRRFDASGSPVTTDTMVNTTTADRQYMPDSAMLAGGNIVVTWMSGGSEDGSGYGVYARLYTVNSTASAGLTAVASPFLVNSGQTSGNQDYPAVTALTGGGFVVTWQDYSAGNTNIRARIYDAAGNGGSIITVAANALEDMYPSIVGLADGGFVVTYVDQGAGNKQQLQRYDSTGTAVGSTLLVGNGYIPGSEGIATHSDMLLLPNGNVAVIWTASDQSQTGIYARVLNTASNTWVSAQVQLNTTTGWYQFFPSASVTADGGFEVGWFSYNDGMMIRRFDASGTPVSDLSVLTLSSSADTVTLQSGLGLVDGGAGDDSITVTGSILSGTKIAGGAGTDQVVISDAAALGTSAFSNVLGVETLTLSYAGASTQSVSLASGSGISLVSAAAATSAVTLSAAAMTSAVTLVGGVGADSLTGGQGNDVLTGGAGADTLTGGSGADTFVYSGGASQSSYSGSAYDVIQGFTAGTDVLTFDGMVGITYSTAAYTWTTSLTNTMTALLADGSLTNRMVFFTDGTDGWLYVKGAGIGTSHDGTLIRLNGVTAAPPLTSLSGPAAVAAVTTPVSVLSAHLAGDYMVLDGTDDYASAGDVFDRGTGDFTIEVWIRPDSTGLSGTRTIIAKDQAGQGDGTLNLFLQDGVVSLLSGDSAMWDASNGFHLKSPTAVEANEWTHLAVVRSGTSYRLLINGQLVDTADGTANYDYNNAYDLIAGARINVAGTGKTDFFDGAIDDIRLWSTARTDAQIQANLETTFSSSQSGLAYYWTADGAGPTSASLATDVTSGSSLTFGSSTAAPTIGTPPDSWVNIASDGSGLKAAGVVTTVTDNVTLEVWGRLTGALTGGAILIYNGDTSTSGYGIMLDDNGHPCIVLGGNTVLTASSVTITAGDWHHYAAVRSGGTWSVVVDGVAYGLGSTAPVVPSGQLWIGGVNPGTQSFLGDVADARVWAVALTSSEIAAHMVTDLTGHESGLVGWWPLDGSLQDASQAGADLQVGGSALFNVPLSATGSVPFEPGLTNVLTGLELGSETMSASHVVAVTLTVAHGTLAMDTQTGLTLDSGAFSGQSSMTFHGTLTDVNNALAAIKYSSSSVGVSADQLSVTVKDLTNNTIAGKTYTLAAEPENTLTILNTAAHPATDGGVLVLDGVDDQAIAHDVTIASGASFSWQFWSYRDSATGADMVLSAGTQGAESLLHVGYTSGGTLKFGFFADDLDYTLTDDDLNQWVQWTGTYDSASNTRTLYRNGVSVASDTAAGDFLGATSLRIGSFDSTDYFHGKVDDVRLWDRALSASEVATNFDVPLTGNESDLQANWSFDSLAAPSVAEDNAGSANTYLTLSGNAFIDRSGGDGALVLDGDGDSAVSAGQVVPTNSSFTWEFWANRASSSTHDLVLAQSTSFATNEAFAAGFLLGGSYGTFHYSFSNNDLNYTLTSDITGQWVHWAGTYDVATNARKLYMNGKMVIEDVAPADYAGTGNLYISDIPWSSNSTPFDGQLDDVRVWSYARTAQEIAANYRQTMTGSESGLVANWTFDQAAVRDNAGANNVLTLQDGAVSRTAADGLLVLDGVNDYGKVSGGLIPDGSSFSWSAWVNRDAEGSVDRVMMQGTVDATDQLMFIGYESDHRFTFGFKNDALTYDVGSDDSGQWVQWSGTYDAASNTLTLYRNGVSVGTQTTSGDFHGWSDFFLGASGASGDSSNFAGQMDDVRVWSRALSSTEVAAQYSGEFGGSQVGLVADWRFEDTTSSTVVDQAGGDHGLGLYNGALVGGAPTSGIAFTTPVDGVLTLDGTGDYATASSQVIAAGASFSWDFWSNRANNLSYDIVLGEGSGGTDAGLAIGYVAGNTFTFSFYNDDVNYTLSADDSGQWMHWAGTYDATSNTQRLYLNGALVATHTTSNDFIGSGNLMVGNTAWGAGGNAFYGQLDNVHVWNAALTDTEVLALARRELTGAETNLQTNWTFDDTGTSTASDNASPGGNESLTLIGNAAQAVAAQEWSRAYSADVDAYNVASGTVEAWVRLDNYNDFLIIQRENSSGDMQGWLGVGDGEVDYADGTVFFHAKNSTGRDGTYELASQTKLALGQWYHVAVTYGAGGANLYINGVMDAVTSTSFALTPDSSGSVYVGQLGQDGNVAGVNVWSPQRSALEIRSDMLGSLVGTEGGLIASWPLSNSLNDSTSNNFDLTASSSYTHHLEYGLGVADDMTVTANVATSVDHFGVLSLNSDSLNVSLSVSHGTISLDSTTGLTIASGAFSSSASMSFTGSAAAIDAALASLRYTMAAGFTASDQIVMTASDTVTGASYQDVLNVNLDHVDHLFLIGSSSADTLYDTDSLTGIQAAAGNDTLYVSTEALAGGTSFDGGAGTDTLVVEQSGGLSDAAFGDVSNMEILRLADSGSLGQGVTLGVNSQNAGITQVDASTAFAGVAVDASSRSSGMQISGSNHSDSLVGGSGSDTISGGGGMDSLAGGAGADTLDGGHGTDMLSGGTGADVFLFSGGSGTAGTVARLAQLGQDIIGDFNASTGDVLTLSNAAFGFGSTGSLSVTSGAKTYLESNVTLSSTAQDMNGADSSTGKAIIMINSGTDTQVWFTENQAAASTGNSYQIAVLQGVTTVDINENSVTLTS